MKTIYWSMLGICLIYMLSILIFHPLLKIYRSQKKSLKDKYLYKRHHFFPLFYLGLLLEVLFLILIFME